MASAPKKEFFFTPLGVVEPYCYLHKADFGRDTFASDRGKYKVNLTVPSKQAQPLIDKIVKHHEAAYAKRVAAYEKNPPVVPRGKKPLLPYEGELPFVENDDGTVTFKFSGYDRYTDKKTEKVIPIILKVVDARGKQIKEVPAISGGSEGKVRFSLFDYGWTATVGASVKLQLDGFMLTKLVEYAAGDQDWANEAEEGGYVADESNLGSPKSDWDGEEDEGGEYEDRSDDNGDF